MATMRTATFYDGPSTPTADDDDKLIIDYDDNTQKIFDKDSNVSAEDTKVKAIYNACFS
jgi:hypothetical protein